MARSSLVYAYSAPCDMRKSFNTLSGLVLEMQEDVMSGALFVFVSRNRRRAKVLYHDGTGLCLLSKRLDSGCFAPIWERSRLAESELWLFLDGSKEVARTALIPSGKPAGTQLSSNCFQ